MLGDIVAGKILPAHLDREAESAKYTSEAVTLPQSTQALTDTREFCISFIDVPAETEIRLRILLTLVLLCIPMLVTAQALEHE